MRRKPFPNGLSMTATLVLVITGVVLGMVAATMALFLATYHRSLLRSAKTSSGQAVAQVTNTVSSYIDDMHEVMGLLESSLEDESVNRDDFFSAFLEIRPDVVAISIYDGEAALQNCWIRDEQLQASIYQNLTLNAALIQENPSGYISQPHVETIFESYYPWVVTMAEPLGQGGTWVALDISFASISDYVNNVGIGQHGYCYIMDEDGSIIYHPQQQLIYSALKQEDTAAVSAMPDGVQSVGNVIYAVQTVPGSQWRVVGVSFVEDLVGTSLNEVTQILMLSAAVILVAAVISGFALSGALSRPLHDLSTAMERFEQDADNFTYDPVGGAREVRNLSASFDHMVGQIQHLMDTVRSEEISLRKTELKALQAQIDPHFLYNTLDSIAWMCERGRNTDAVQMVNALARLFRISISKGHELIPIRNEIQHAESYLQIQNYRYKNQFTYSFDVDPACEGFLCNKITLQPMIENAIYHGINGLVEEGEIRITVRADGEDILFTVEDNGVGMEQSQVDALLHREPGDRTGIGIKNVADRLRIYFGDQYGITIESEPDVGTRILIRMPKIREEGDYEKR
ncbi:MAG: sensor histidine kinase [Oscillospiraceae bacterium]|nr:sensor histidine kinase [Oscillospiraceae bacterium]